MYRIDKIYREDYQGLEARKEEKTAYGRRVYFYG